MTKQITVYRESTKIICDCGFYDKAFSPINLARTHNSREHGGNYRIYDHDRRQVIRQLDGLPE